ncbi:hypothetical protein [Kibdelosporangium philippinense]|uniref:hypothetical protein n=1 Tax=Kibdelosporangium philippinense TaxID=211113 RepID=UPI003612ECB1
MRANRTQLKQRVGVVATVARKAIDLIEDDVVDVAAPFDKGEHALELATVSGLGTLALVDEHRHHLSAQGLSLAAAGFFLSR